MGEKQSALIGDTVNRLYLSGFKSSAGYLLITRQRAYFLIDFRYFEKAKAEIKHLEVLRLESFYSQINSILSRDGINELLIESDRVSIKRFKGLSKNITEAKVSEENFLSDTLEKLRQIKTKEEIAAIEEAQSITDEGFRHILQYIDIGKTEREIALELEFFMRKSGSDGIAFDIIAVSGKNSSLPHGVPTDKRLEKGDFLTLDFGAVAKGYMSDMTRTVGIGSLSDYQKEVYATVLKAQTEALKGIKAEASCKEIDKIARDIINNAGFEGCFGHGLGHSLGLEIHEAPACNMRDESLLKPNMLMTVEPGIYIENLFGVRIEDMVLITEKGYENLTHSPKELIIL